MPDDARPTPDVADAVPDVDGPVAVPDPDRARLAAEFEDKRTQYKEKRAAIEQDRKQGALLSKTELPPHLVAANKRVDMANVSPDLDARIAAAEAKEAARSAEHRTRSVQEAASGGASRFDGKDNRQQPSKLSPTFEPSRRASLPRLINLGKDEAALPGFPDLDAPEPDSQMLLPMHGITDTLRGCSSWLLWLFDRVGGEKSWKGGRGAPWPLRLFVYALLHLDVTSRDGEWHTVRVDTKTVIKWLHPNGWNNMSRDWHLLPASLDWMRRLAYVPVPGFGRVAILFPSVIPSAPTDPLVEFTMRIPSVAAHGDRLEWLLLRRYGAESARLFRAYLAVVAWLGRSARNGHSITRMIAAPMHHPDGKMRRRKGGGIVRSKTRYIPNPSAKYAGPELTERDLANMMGFDGNDRRRRTDARIVFEQIDSDGVIDLQRCGHRFVIFGASRHQELRRKSAAGGAEFLLDIMASRKQKEKPDPLTRARLVDMAPGEARRAVVHALRDVRRDELVSAKTLKKAAGRLEIIAI